MSAHASSLWEALSIFSLKTLAHFATSQGEKVCPAYLLILKLVMTKRQSGSRDSNWADIGDSMNKSKLRGSRKVRWRER